MGDGLRSLAANAAGMAAEGTIVTSTVLDDGGDRGIEVRVVDIDHQLIARAVAHGDRIYQLSVEGQPGEPAAYARVVGSLTFLPWRR